MGWLELLPIAFFVYFIIDETFGVILFVILLLLGLGDAPTLDSVNTKAPVEVHKNVDEAQHGGNDSTEWN